MEDEIISLMDAGQYALAIEKLRAESKRASNREDYIACRFLEATALRMSGNIAAALILLDELESQSNNATLPFILLEKASCLEGTSPREALTILESVNCDQESLTLDPTLALRISGAKGAILTNLGRFEEAEKFLFAAEALPENAALEYNLGLCLAHKRNFDAALAKWDKAAKLTEERDPLRWLIFYSIASCNLTLRNIHAAQAAIHQCESSSQEWAKPEKLSELVRQLSKVH